MNKIAWLLMTIGLIVVGLETASSVAQGIPWFALIGSACGGFVFGVGLAEFERKGRG